MFCTIKLKTGVILPISPLFKGKGAKTKNKDNYMYGHIALFPMLCKIYKMILLNRLENFAKQNQFFSDMQMGFQESVGCTDAFFLIFEAINHMLEQGSRIFSCYLDVQKATV